MPIRGTEARARRELKDAEALERQADRVGASRSGSGMLLRRSRQLFGSPRRGSATLTRARRFLEEALALDETLDEARLYLGFRHAVIGRADRARIQFRKVYCEGRTSLLRLIAAQSLGKLHSESGDYTRAIECYEEVVASEDAQSDAAELFPSFLNLAVNYAKAGEVAKSTDTFADLAQRFPERSSQIRELLSRKTFFQDLLNQNLTLKQTLASRAPALFAA
jgi:tetratricopeptide (TPR) repeat protein